MLTCFSALLFLLARYEKRGTVFAEDILEMISNTPTARIEKLATELNRNAAADTLRHILICYNRFLEDSNLPEDELIARFHDSALSKAALENASLVGEGIFQALTEIGNNSRFHRLLMV